MAKHTFLDSAESLLAAAGITINGPKNMWPPPIMWPPWRYPSPAPPAPPAQATQGVMAAAENINPVSFLIISIHSVGIHIP